MLLDPQLMEMLACPADNGPLLYFSDESFLYNPRARLLYRIEKGIPIMLIEEATQLDITEHQRLVNKAQTNFLKPTYGEG